MKQIFFNYWITGGAGIVFFFLALFDLLKHETNARRQWNQSWELMSIFGKLNTIICVSLLLWTVGYVVIGGIVNAIKKRKR